MTWEELKEEAKKMGCEMIVKTWHQYEVGFGVYYAKCRITKLKTLRITFLWWSIDFMWGVK